MKITSLSSGEYGIHEKPWFLFTPSYWWPRKIKTVKQDDLNEESEVVEAVSDDIKQNDAIKLVVQTNTETNKHRNKHRNKQTNTETNKQTKTETNKQTNKQTNTETNKQPQ